MDLLEIERTETLRREELARRLHAFVDSLARHNDVEFDRGGTHFKLKVPDEIRVKVGARGGGGRDGARDRADLVTLDAPAPVDRPAYSRGIPDAGSSCAPAHASGGCAPWRASPRPARIASAMDTARAWATAEHRHARDRDLR